ncbi:MAG: M14 family metallopeptidase [candidate division Zixibacteria bacterium]
MKLNSILALSLVVLMVFISAGTILADTDPASSPSGSYFATDQYDPAIPKPSEFLGFPLASKPASHAQMSGYLTKLAESSDKARLFEYGETYEGHTLYYLLVTSEENMAKISSIKDGHSLLSDPRRLKSKKETDRLINDLPAVVWAGYGIHGDELSSTDAAIATAYQLVSGNDDNTNNILDNLVIVIDPMQNPDGRERFLTQVRQFSGKIPNPDLQSVQHTGVWPWGRGNHYFIDLNRDMFTLVHPETRGKVAVCLEWKPQLMIDSHEMGALSSYLFSPPREPFNPHWPKDSRKWWDIFAADQAKAFDNYGWSYFTREWNEEWFPGYTSSWGIFLGMVGILYEQAGVDGSLVKQRDGRILTYAESVHHHFVSSMANISTAANKRKDLLRHYHNARRVAVENSENSIGGSFIVDPSQNPHKTSRLINSLLLQGIEIKKAKSDFNVSGLYNEHGKASSKKFKAGSYIIDFAQPSRQLLQVLLEYDIRMTNKALFEERRSIEKNWGSRMYEVSAWCLPLAYGLESYISNKKVLVSSEIITAIPSRVGTVKGDDPLYGYMVGYTDDAATYLLADAFGKKLKARIATKPSKINGNNFKRGSLLFVKKENPENLREILAELGQKYGLEIIAVNTALAADGSDLGGSNYRLLAEPKIAMLTSPPISLSNYGSLWHMLDYDFGLRLASVDINRLSRTDLTRYNVLIMPSIWGGPGLLKSVIGKGGISKLKKWVEDGGTLVAFGSGATFCADSTVGISKVALRSQSLDKLDEYEYALERELAADKVVIDSMRIWDNVEPKKKDGKKKGDKKEEAKKPGKDEMKRLDDFARKFSPQGVIFECKLDTTQWLTYGMGEKLPVLAYTDDVFLTKPPVRAAARFESADKIRLSGLAWPEARQRWANSAYCTREGKGKGQVILFSSHPYMRSLFYGSKRLLINAILLGPGMGARQSVPY